jgi:metal-dependent amidase/aminoacylase/carboxypeptidase family protein
LTALAPLPDDVVRDVIAIRRDLHIHPELGFAEHRTAAFFAERVPACFYSIGCHGDDASSFPHHHATFDIGERALETGVRIATAIAFDAPEHGP